MNNSDILQSLKLIILDKISKLNKISEKKVNQSALLELISKTAHNMIIVCDNLAENNFLSLDEFELRNLAFDGSWFIGEMQAIMYTGYGLELNISTLNPKSIDDITFQIIGQTYLGERIVVSENAEGMFFSIDKENGSKVYVKDGKLYCKEDDNLVIVEHFPVDMDLQSLINLAREENIISKLRELANQEPLQAKKITPAVAFKSLANGVSTSKSIAAQKIETDELNPDKTKGVTKDD